MDAVCIPRKCPVSTPLPLSLPPSSLASLPLPQNCLIQKEPNGVLRTVVADFGLAARIKQAWYVPCCICAPNNQNFLQGL